MILETLFIIQKAQKPPKAQELTSEIPKPPETATEFLTDTLLYTTAWKKTLGNKMKRISELHTAVLIYRDTPDKCVIKIDLLLGSRLQNITLTE